MTGRDRDWNWNGDPVRHEDPDAPIGDRHCGCMTRCGDVESPRADDLLRQARAARQSAARNRTQAGVYSEIGEYESAAAYLAAAERADARAAYFDRKARAKEYPAVCPTCGGTGGGVYNDCPTCDGNGVV